MRYLIVKEVINCSDNKQAIDVMDENLKHYFEELYDEFSPIVMNIAYSVLNDEELAKFNLDTFAFRHNEGQRVVLVVLVPSGPVVLIGVYGIHCGVEE